jgi:hypothetical protein
MSTRMVEGCLELGPGEYTCKRPAVVIVGAVGPYQGLLQMY